MTAWGGHDTRHSGYTHNPLAPHHAKDSAVTSHTESYRYVQIQPLDSPAALQQTHYQHPAQCSATTLLKRCTEIRVSCF